MSATTFQEIKNSLRALYLEDARPWLVGFSGGKDSTMLASLVFDVVMAVPAEQRKKPISVLCTDTRVEIPAIADMIEGALARMRKCSQQHNLNIDANLLKPKIEESFWVNIIGRAAILAIQRMKADDRKLMLALPRSTLSTDNLTIECFGLAAVSESAEKYHQILDLLSCVAAEVEKEGFSTQGFGLLETVYGDSSPGVTGSGLLAQYKAELESQKPGAHPRDDVEKNAAHARFLDALGRDIRTFTLHLKAMLLARTTPLPEPLLDSLLLLPQDELDKIMRYEAHLERQFQLLLQRSMSCRKVYVDVSGAETWKS